MQRAFQAALGLRSQPTRPMLWTDRIKANPSTWPWYKASFQLQNAPAMPGGDFLAWTEKLVAGRLKGAQEHG